MLYSMMLLHPYLPRLFAALGWLDASHAPGEAFPSACLPRAAALLNWLATGRDDPLEYELGTAKLLLDRLPWGIAMVRLPWLPYTVHSEWSHR